MSSVLIESGHRWAGSLRQAVASAYGVSGPAVSVTRPGPFTSTPGRRRLSEAGSVIVTIKARERSAEDQPPKDDTRCPEGRHLIFRRALSAYARVADLPPQDSVASSAGGSVIDRAAVYKDRSYF